VLFTGPFFWGFFALVSAGVIVLRFRSPKLARPYRVPLYPIVPLLFGLGCVFMCWMTIKYVVSQRNELPGYVVGAVWAGSVLLAGLLVATLGKKKAGKEESESG